ncbi:MAG: hypothetical protein JXA66_00715 [Oligoflexia bacterium]|nr:hypothetical protein [Oligoflexia bacterium]
MKYNRTFREIVSAPVFFVLFAVFLVLTGYRFYSLLISYIELTGMYPDFVFGAEIKRWLAFDINIGIFPKLFVFYSYLVIILVPLLLSSLSNDRKNRVDQVELLCSGRNEFSLLMDKVSAVILVLGILFIPTLIYPFLLSFFAAPDYGILVSSYFALLLLSLLAAASSLPLSILELPPAIASFINIVLFGLIHNYFLSGYISSFFIGSIDLSFCVFFIVCFCGFVFFSVKVYFSGRYPG